MKIAVLISTYNGEKYIRDQIESIMSQKVDAQIDIIVRDDGSTDKTKDILEEYSKQKKLKWYTGENLKPANSFFNLLIQNETYDYYAFADQDDYWKNDKLRRAIEKIQIQ